LDQIDEAPLLYEHRGAIAFIRLNRPNALNVLDLPMAQAFLETCRQLKETPEVKVVVLSGAGKAFMGGGDLSWFHDDLANAPSRAAALIEPFHAALQIMTSLPQIVLASVHGAVAGGGFSLALACDLLIAAEGTRFTMAYSKIGTSPDGSGSWSLPRTVGLHKAMEIALLSDVFDAQEAQRLGIVSRVVPLDSLAADTEALAQRLASGPGTAYAKTKQLLRCSLSRSIQEQMNAELEAFRACAATSDFHEGVSAFFEKRNPVFVGS
jgi:2-(1,2-epoxy-1,2-dihydrophenyl)acetyl-CoA isomerase